ncbi:sialidase-1-like [Anneissia japonica]|uniref:sialidase-1-like n=1 Tax=Anneissia japonica TaxID=1529436 RepID=UPI001425ADD9|nr:sialidase-1-like [Anneissia japonica]
MIMEGLMNKLFRSLVCAYIFCAISINGFSVKPEVVLEQNLWVSGEDAEISEYRTPVMIRALNGDILAFAGARKISHGDASAKVIIMRRSKNGGNKWGPSVFVVDDYMNTDGLNLGNAIVDEQTGAIIFIYSFCIHNECDFSKYTPTNFKTVSYDHGYTWSPPVDLAEKSPFFEGWNWAPGPGYGIQKKLAPNVGRLFACGHWGNSTYGLMTCIYSDDHGETWTQSEFTVYLPNNMTKNVGDFTPGEPQIVELSDGRLLINARNQHFFHSRNRLIFYSDDGGKTFPMSNLRVDLTLLEPGCFASTLIHQGVMFFSNPFDKSSRVNMTLRWSLDEGMSWAGSLGIYSKGSGYSCLSPIDDNHIGLLFEKDGYKEMHFVKIKFA